MKIINFLFYIKFIINRKISGKIIILVTKCDKKLLSICDKKLVLLTKLELKNKKKN